MLILNISPEAIADLDDIWDFVASNNENAADQLIDEITQKFDLLLTVPEGGRLRPDLQPRLRIFPAGRFVIFYRVGSNDIEIVRVLHGARDIESLFS